jgi:TRAP-type C4-dicarboxylate transport system substrate-binding protein
MKQIRFGAGARILALSSIVLAALVAAAPAAAQQITIKEGHATIRSGQDHWANTFKEYVEKRSGGRIKIDVFPGGQLGQQTALIQGAQLGTIEIVQTATEFLTVVDARFDIFASPGVFDDIAHAHRTLHDAQFREAIWTITEPKNIKLIGFACESLADYASVEPIRTIAEFKGKKFRVLGSKLEIEMLRRFGATGIPMQLGEALPALQQKAIDGARAGTIVFVALKFQSVARNVLKSGESVICVPKMASKRWLEGLPADLRTIILEEAARAEDANLAYSVDLLAKTYDAWKGAGGVINELSPAEKEEFRRRIQTVPDEVFKDSPLVKEAYETLKAAAARARK